MKDTNGTSQFDVPILDTFYETKETHNNLFIVEKINKRTNKSKPHLKMKSLKIKAT